MMGDNTEYQKRTYTLVIPCIVQLGAGAKEAMWKNLNYQVCLATRHSTAMVKSAAVSCLSEFFGKIGDRYTFLLLTLFALITHSSPFLILTGYYHLCQTLYSLFQSCWKIPILR